MAAGAPKPWFRANESSRCVDSAIQRPCKLLAAPASPTGARASLDGGLASLVWRRASPHGPNAGACRAKLAPRHVQERSRHGLGGVYGTSIVPSLTATAAPPTRMAAIS